VGDASFADKGKFGLGMEFGGSGDWVDTGSCIVDTTGSYSVAAWVYLARGFETNFRTAVSQDGDEVSGFYLQYGRPESRATGDSLRLSRWIESSGGLIADAHSKARPGTNRWIHVVGIQDTQTHRLQLYVDGKLIENQPYPGDRGAYEWKAPGNTVIGRGQFNAGPVDPFLGRIDEVYLFQGVLSPQEIGRIMVDKYLAQPPTRGTPDMVREIPEIAIDLKHLGGAISPLLFGHNLEHTRRAVWQGISAQLLANRKFAGPSKADGPNRKEVVRGQPGPAGVVAQWYAIGEPAARFAPDQMEHYAGLQSQRISIATADGTGGIGQGEIPLKQGLEYETRFWLKADRRLTVTASLCDELRQKPYATNQQTIEPGDWREWVFTFKAPASDLKSRLEITFDGSGSLWLGAASLMPADNLHGMRRDVIELLKQMKVSLLRWPGGNFTRDYRWQEGLLPVDRRAPIVSTWSETLPFTDNYDFHDIGIDEFIHLCRSVGCEPSLTINLNPKAAPPEETAAWVEYCNGPANTTNGKIRASRGQKEPYGVKYWSIGNEIWGSWMGPAHCDAATYAARVRPYAEAMKKADPSIMLIASGQHGAWDRAVVTQAGTWFDQVSEHNYAPAARAGSPNEMDRELARLSRFAGADLLTLLENDRRIIDQAAPQGKKIPIAFDEWNVWHNWLVRPGDEEWHAGIIGAGYAASMLNMLGREAEPLGLSMAAFFQPVNEGAIAVGPYAATLTPVGQVFALFAVHQGARLVKLDPGSGGPGLDACASLSDDRTLHMTFVNRTHAKARKVDLILRNAPITGEASVRLLVARDLKSAQSYEERTNKLTGIKNGHLSFVLPRYSVARLDVPLAGNVE